MIGYNNAVRTAKNSFAGIVWRQNTFDNEFACPSRADASHVIPCETRPRFAVGYGDFARSHRAAVTHDIRRKCHTPRLHVEDNQARPSKYMWQLWKNGETTHRSKERRVGKEGVRTGRSRWS